MNIFYIGSSGALSLIPFKKLLSTEHAVSAVGVYKPLVFTDKIIALENESLAMSARQQEIPVLDMSLTTDRLCTLLSDLHIELILLSCYAKRLPVKVVNLASAGCFNMHPSLLPGYRGPEPIFWQMKAASDTGVSWHRVTEDLDAGDIAKQQRVALDDGMSFEQINHRLATAGASLMMSLLSDCQARTLKMTPQDEARASYYPYPEKQDFTIDTSWSARRAYNFMRATQAYGYGYRCKSGGYDLVLEQALDFDNNASLHSIEVQGERLFIPFKEGVLIATYTGKLGR